MSTNADKKTGVVLMSYGSATTAPHVAEYFKRIYKGKESQALILDFENRYRLVGHSPLVEITKKQASLLQEKLGKNYVVCAGMRHSEPFIEKAVTECKEGGATKLVGIILSPQFSSFVMEGYKTSFMGAAQTACISEAVIALPWPSQDRFIELLTTHIKDALTKIKADLGLDAPVIFTTHSLPKRVIENDPSYLEQLQATINAVTEKLPLNLKWYAGYQSAGHTPEEWLKPDLVSILAKLHEQKITAVLIVPIQFLADHLEILYDLDIAVRKQCEEFSIAYNRIELPNTDGLFIDVLADIARRTEISI